MRKHLLLSIFISTVNIIEPTRAPKPPNVPTKPSCSSVRERSDFIFEIPELNTPPVIPMTPARKLRRYKRNHRTFFERTTVGSSFSLRGVFIILYVII